MADGQVVFEITADGKHAIASVKDITNAIDRETKNWDRATQKSTENIESSFMGMVKKVASVIGAAQIGKAILNWGKAAIDAASDLAEVQNVVDVTFGDGAKQIEAWAKTAGKQFGLTETQAKKFTSTLGAMMKSAGMSGDEIIGMSTDLAGLAADMASFYNLDFETAFQKIRSGISGETEPLKQLGVNMSVANLEAFALEKGITKAFNSMNQKEQTLLRYQYLMKATADAQGDFARTSDGFANASRRVESALDTISAKGGSILMTIIEPLTTGLAGLLEKMTAQPERTVLDDFNDINANTSGKMADLNETYAKAQSIVTLIGEIGRETAILSDGSQKTFADLFRELENVEKNGGDYKETIRGLGLDVDYVSQKYELWKHSFSELEKMVPGLTGDIRNQNAAIDDTQKALQDNLDAWKANEEKKIMWTAIYAKRRALEEKKAGLFEYEFDWRAAEQRSKKAAYALTNIYGAAFDENGILTDESFNAITYADGGKNANKFATDLQHYKILLDETTAAQTEYERQTKALNEAIEYYESGLEGVEEIYGKLTPEEEALISGTKELGEATAETTQEMQAAADAAKEAVEAVKQYDQSVRDATAASVNSTLSGFGHIDTAAKKYKDAANELEEFEKQLREANKYSEAEIKIKLDAKNAQITLQTLTEGLESQIAYIEEYERNLQRAQELGVSGAVLSQLMDGSQESAATLHALTEAYAEWDGQGVPEDIAKLNSLYDEVDKKKKTFADSLADQQLTIDQTYQSMVEKAKQAVSELDLQSEAAEEMGKTISGLAEGITAHQGEVKTAVDNILSELDRLSGLSFNINLGAFGSFGFSLDGSHETGLNYVPFDGYLAELHEGEGILTAEENRIWQRFRDGQGGTRNVDYDALGGLMRDNIKPGGNVYLDGRAVGQVISQIQGNQYRSLQRSGWQQ